jgi:uncharacterized membrane protein
LADELAVPLLASARDHVRHHGRFYVSALLGLGTWTGGSLLRPAMRMVVAGNGFFAIYLASTALFALRSTPDDMRRRASYADEGMTLIILITLCAISLSLGAIFTLVGGGRLPPLEFAFTIASVPLGWFTLHTVAAFRYAHLYYTKSTEAPAEAMDEERDAAGLCFPGTPEPELWDFLYYSFVIGMTSQVSDVQVQSPAMRRMTLTHGVTSFFFNTVLLALAVNLGATYAS